MARYPKAVWKPWNPYNPERYVTPRLCIFHTNAVDSHDPGPTGTLSWNGQIDEDGTVYQHRDTLTRAAANAEVNGFANSWETWDGGDPENTPWTDAQVDTIVDISHWEHAQHDIPLQLAPAWDGAGFGYHRMYAQWDEPYHSCPGDLRARQFHDVVWPRVIAPPPAPQPKEVDVPAPAIITNQAGLDEVFVRGADGQLWAHTESADWYPLGGRLTSGPAATVRPDGSVRVVGRGEDGATWERVRDANGSWSDWYSLGGQS